MNKQIKVVGRRRSRSLVGFASKDLCETVPKSHSPSDRLLMLLELCFQYSLSDVQKEMKEDFDISTFREKGTVCWEQIKNIIEEKNLHQLAVAENINPSESFVNENAEEYNAAMAKLQAESEKWSNQISLYRETLKKHIDSPHTIDSSVWKDNDQLHDYSDVIESTCSAHQRLSQQIASLSSTKVTFRKCFQLNKTFHESLRWKCERYFHHSISDSPRTLMKKMSSTKKRYLNL